MTTPIAIPRPSATLIVARDAAGGIEVLMGERSPHASFLAGMFVFPGGVIAPEDGDLRCVTDAAASMDALEVARRSCAIRETFEEVGLVFACAPDGALVSSMPAAHAASLAEWRRSLHAGQTSCNAICQALSLRLDIESLAPFGNWITPIGLPRRFDTHFYVARLPDGQSPVHDGSEFVTHRWISPGDATQAYERGEFPIVHATARTLKTLLPFKSTDELLQFARRQKQTHGCLPRLASDSKGRRVVDPDHPAYAEIGRRDPTGTLGISCELAPGPVARLSDRIERVTAHNGSFMTGPGTNTYILGAGRDVALIDPGPNDPRHIEGILAALGERRLKWILVTHTHPDHSPAAAPLKLRTEARLIGLPPPEHGPQDRSFMPDQTLANGERIELAGLILRAVHTPGHASNHLCYLLEDERTLFTGDHIMQGSTVVIPPPDGNMTEYLASLRMLLAEPLDWLAPGHGFLMDVPHQRIERLLAHRTAREDKVCNALERLGTASLEELLSIVYDDVPARAHAVAARSLGAHLIKLCAEGRAREHGGRWVATHTSPH